jgi:hypothetical protein
MKRILLPLLTLALLPIALRAGDPHPRVDVWGSRSALTFEPNRGQTGAGIRYLTHAANGLFLFTDRGVVLPGSKGAVAFDYVGESAHAVWEASDATGDTTSYFVGRDPAKWARDVAHYRRLIRRQVYPGIDLVYYGKGNRLEYDFLLAPYADPSRIRIRVKGAGKLSIDPNGALVVETAAGAIRHERPELYETLSDGSRRKVAGAFRLIGRNQAGFVVGPRDRRLPLSIDPVLESSTYFGGGGDDAVVSTNGTYFVGTTTSVDVPGAGFARRGGSDVFVQYGTTTYQTLVIGGSGDEHVTSVSFQSLGAVLIGGYTNSTDLPTNVPIVTNPFLNYRPALPTWQANYAGGNSDGFVMLFDFNTSQTISFISYLGTPGDDQVTGVALNSAGFALVGTTNGTGLPQQSTNVYAPFQPQPAGGMDGFLILASYNIALIQMYGSTYFGGSGNDTPLGVYYGNTGLYVTGQTTSPDFPIVGGKSGHDNAAGRSPLNGVSDAFVARFNTGSKGLMLTASRLYGGRGSDSGVAISQIGYGNIVVAGTTSSTDLPLLNPTQASYGGGASDAFVAQFSADLSQMVSATYIGGSGADQASSIAADNNGNVFVGGWTSSRDFPVTANAVQTKYGGDPDDGFLVHFDIDGSLRQATYFGGSGSDHILGLTAVGGPTVWLAGQTTSPNLPLQNPTQSTLSGPSDGFFAKISDNLIDLSPFSGAKDARIEVSFGVDFAFSGGTPAFTITSSDPTQVQVAVNSGDTGQGSVQLSNGSYYFYVDCLTDNGGAVLTIAGPGYVTRTVPVGCYPAQIEVTPAGPSVTTYLGQQSPVNLYFYLYGKLPNGQLTYGGILRPGANPITIQIANSNPVAGTVPSSVQLTSNNVFGPSASFIPAAIGTATLSFSAPIPITPSSLQITVAQPADFYASVLAVPTGFQSALPAYFTGGNTTSWTYTSSDPSRVILSSDPTQMGTASASDTGPIYAQAIGAPGDVTVTLTVPGQGSQTITIHITAPVALLYPSGVTTQPISMAVAESRSFYLYLGDTNGLLCSCTLLPGAPALPFSIVASNPSTVSISPSTVMLGAGTGAPSIVVTGASAGSTLLDLKTPPGVGLAPAAHSFSVVVVSKPLVMSDVTVGNNLAGYASVTLPLAALTSATTVQFSIDNPALALLSPDTTTAGASQVTVKINGNPVYVYVYGLAASGQAKLTATVTGFGSITANVTLAPSGFGWNTVSYSSTLYTPSYQNVSPNINALVLDPVSLLPVGAQSIRPSVTGTVSFNNSNSSVISITPGRVALPSNSFAGVAITGLTAGTAVLSIVQPPGFTTPAIRQQLPVTIKQPTLSMPTFTVGYDLQTAFTVSSNLPPTAAAVLVTVTSSDPTRLLISSSATAVGSASVTVASYNLSSIMLQALDSQGSVTITASAPTFNNGTTTVNFAQTGVGLTLASSNTTTTNSNGQLQTSTQSQPTPIAVQLYLVNGQQYVSNTLLRPGAGPLPLAITSSATNVGTITGSPLQLATGQTPSTASFVPAGIGQANVTVVQPPGFVAVAQSTLTFVVSAPGFSAQSLLMAKDTFVSDYLALSSYVTAPTLNAAVTLTSSDPTRLVLSPDTSTQPTASITQTLVAGRTQVGSFYVHALANSGTVTIQISAPGYAASTINVQLTDLAFAFNYYNGLGTPLRVVLQKGAQTITVSPVVVPLANSTNGVGGATIRPGANITVNVSSSDPTTVSLASPQVVFTGGATSATVTYTPLKAGSVTLSVNPPSGYLTTSASQVALNVVQSQLSLQNSYSGQQLGRDLQASTYATSESGLTPQMTLTVASSDPTRLLVSTSATVLGQASITLVPTSTQNSPNIYLQALSDNGTPSVTVSSPGYQSGSTTVALNPSAAVFTSSSAQNIYTNSGPQNLNVAMSYLDPLTLQPRGNQSPRPGAVPTVTVTSSNPSAVTVSTPSIQIPISDPANGFQYGTATIQPVAAGTAVITLSEPEGVTPASGGQEVFNVAQPSLFVPAFTLGQTLAAPVQIQLASSLPTPTSPVTISVTGNYPLEVASTATGNPTFSLQATIPAGQRASQTFYVDGLSTGSGSLSFFSSGYGSTWSTPATISQTAFVFKEAGQTQPISVGVNTSANFTVAPALSLLATPVLAPLMIRGGASPITVTVTSSNPGVLSVLTPTVTLNPGDQQVVVNVKGLAAGTATLKLSGTSSYDFTTSQATVSVVVQ